MRKKIYEREIVLYDCGIDPNHPCWGGKQNGCGTCGKSNIYRIVYDDDEGIYEVWRQYHEWDTHSVYSDDHYFFWDEAKLIRTFQTKDEAIEYIEDVRKHEEYNP